MVCHDRQNHERKARRKAELAAMPRCEVPGCRRRAAWTAGAGQSVGLCGKHLNAARGKVSRHGIIGMLCGANISGPALIKLATE
jgi:hypothetical protein